jgi:hypothetical protein
MKFVSILLLLSSCAINSRYHLYQTVSTKSNCTGQILGIKKVTFKEAEYMIKGCGRVAESEIR